MEVTQQPPSLGKLQPRPQQVLQVDTLDDRREIVTLLDQLHPRRRIAFLAWCCQQAGLGSPDNPIRPRVSEKTKALAELAMKDDSASAKLTIDIYFDVFCLTMTYNFDLNRAVHELERLVRKPAV